MAPWHCYGIAFFDYMYDTCIYGWQWEVNSIGSEFGLIELYKKSGIDTVIIPPFSSTILFKDYIRIINAPYGSI